MIAADPDVRVMAAVHAVLEHEGYGRDEIAAAEMSPAHHRRCEFDGIDWDCTGMDGEPLHPLSDRIGQLAAEAEVMLSATDPIAPDGFDREPWDGIPGETIVWRGQIYQRLDGCDPVPMPSEGTE